MMLPCAAPDPLPEVALPEEAGVDAAPLGLEPVGSLAVVGAAVVAPGAGVVVPGLVPQAERSSRAENPTAAEASRRLVMG